MKYIVQFSGGKDSLATLIWAKENLVDFEVIMCDTGWELYKTYDHVKTVEKALNLKIKILTNVKGVDLLGLARWKKRFPSTTRRFCTTILKVEPFIDYLLTIEDDVQVLQGIRGDESRARSKMDMTDEYFKGYAEPLRFDKKGKPVWSTYRKKEVLCRLEKFDTVVYRPIFLSSAEGVFSKIKRFGLTANPLYYEGFARVGCFLCIMCSLNEIKLIAINYPERIDLIRQVELECNTTFFPPNYIPAHFCTKTVYTKKQRVKVPTIDDVVKYVLKDTNQLNFYVQPACQSHYNICE